MTVVSAPLYVFFGWLSDRVGRKPVMVGGMLLALVLYFPASTGSPMPPTRRWSRRSARRRWSSRPIPRPARSSSTRSAPRSSPAPATSPRALLVDARAFPTRRAHRPTARRACMVGDRRLPIAERRRPRGAGLQGAQGHDRRADRRPRWQAAGYPEPAPIPAAINMPLLIARAAAVRGRRDRALRAAGRGAGRDVPDPRPLHRDVPALSRRHRLGRRLPAGHQLRARRDHRQYLRGLWYAVFFTAISVVVALLFLKETRGKPLEEV